MRVYWRHLSVCTAPMACHIYQEVHSKGWLRIMPEVSGLGTIGQRKAQHTKLSLVIPMTQVISPSLMPSTSLIRAIMDRYSILTLSRYITRNIIKTQVQHQRIATTLFLFHS